MLSIKALTVYEAKVLNTLSTHICSVQHRITIPGVHSDTVPTLDLIVDA